VAASYPRRRRAQTKKIVMSRNIDDYFSMHAPWAYIGHVPLMEIAHRHDVKVTYKPISLSEVFAETGGLPVTKHHSARLSYRILELHRSDHSRLRPQTGLLSRRLLQDMIRIRFCALRLQPSGKRT
jgi:hypothetical protein